MRERALLGTHPVMSCEEAHAYERAELDTEENAWDAMRSVGQKLGRDILREYRVSRYSGSSLSVLGMIGKGHNGGDALLGIHELVQLGVVDSATIAIAGDRKSLRPNTERALELLESAFAETQIKVFEVETDDDLQSVLDANSDCQEGKFDICIDGLVGMQFQPPLRGGSRCLVDWANQQLEIRLRIAIDLPSGIGDTSDSDPFMADITFATGIFKTPLSHTFLEKKIGCIRYLDIGLVNEPMDSDKRILVDESLNPLRGRRQTHVDKRSYGHLVILAGSRQMPGALIMSVRSALKSGVGLVTVCAPESIVPQAAAIVPEAMWIPWPETQAGGLSFRGLDLIRPVQMESTALLVGPGMGGDGETISMLIELLKRWTGSIVMDADALQQRVLHWVQGNCIATPHLGEFKRVAGLERSIGNIDDEIKRFSRSHSVVLALKGPLTRITDGDRIYLNTTGNSVLARGGSGDILAGLTAGLLAQSPQSPLEVACRSAFWHGKAADLLASRKGQVAVRTTELLDCLSGALDEEENR